MRSVTWTILLLLGLLGFSMFATAKDLTSEQQKLVAVEEGLQSELDQKERLVGTALKEANACASKGAIRVQCGVQLTELANLVIQMNHVSSKLRQAKVATALSFCDENPSLASEDSQYYGGPVCP